MKGMALVAHGLNSDVYLEFCVGVDVVMQFMCMISCTLLPKQGELLCDHYCWEGMLQNLLYTCKCLYHLLFILLVQVFKIFQQNRYAQCTFLFICLYHAPFRWRNTGKWILWSIMENFHVLLDISVAWIGDCFHGIYNCGFICMILHMRPCLIWQQ